MRYVSMVTIFTMVFGLSFWSTDFNSVYADSTSVGASKDSWVDQAHTSDNHGDDAELKVKSKNNSDNRRTYVAFDVSTLPSNAVVQSAIMSLWMKTNSSQDRTYGVYRVTDDWTEGEITWSNKSATASTATGTTSVGTDNNVFISWNVTSDVQAFKAGTYSNYGWMVRDEAENNSSSQEKKFKSKENDTSAQRPKLEIVYDIIEPTGSISGHKFNDLNGDGFWDLEGENPEPGLANWTITLSNGDEVTTDENGYYTFGELEDGEYTVCEVIPDDNKPWIQTGPSSGAECEGDTYGYSVEISDGNEAVSKNFGNYRNGSILGIKWEDLNADGEFDEEEEPVLEGWVVFLDLNDSGVLDEDEPYQETDEDGFYSFENLAPGTYVVREVLEEGWMQIFPDSDTDSKHMVTVTSGEEEQNWNFGNFKLATITGFKWDDKNGDGVWQKENEENSGEPGLQDVIVALGRVNGEPTQEDGHEVIPIEIVALSLTGIDGGFQISDVAPGHYKLFEEKKSGWQATNPAPSIDSFFDITYAAIGDPDFDLLRLRNPDFGNPISFFDVFAELSGQDVNQSEATRTASTAIPSVSLEFGNHQLSIISEESVPKIDETSVTITWNTDRPATSRVIYDTVSYLVLGNGLCPFPLDALECYGYALSTPESDLEPKVLEHSVVINGLTAGTTYYFRSVSHASPESIGSESSFNTQYPSSDDNDGGSSGGGGGAPGSIILDGPTPISQTDLEQTTLVPVLTPSATPAPLFVADAVIISDESEVSESSMATFDFENKSLDESDQVVYSSSIIPEASEENQKTPESNNLFASLFDIFGILNSASFWWLAIIVLVALILFRISSKKDD